MGFALVKSRGFAGCIHVELPVAEAVRVKATALKGLCFR